MIPIQPWMIKLAAGLTIFGVVFLAGGRVQKKMDMRKINALKLEVSYKDEQLRVSIENTAILKDALDKQNEAYIELGTETERRIQALNEAHQAALTRARAATVQARRDAEAETERLRQLLAGLSLEEACMRAWVEVVQ